MIRNSDSSGSIFAFPPALWRDIFLFAAIGYVSGIGTLALIQFFDFGLFPPRILPQQGYLDRVVFGVSSLIFAPFIENLFLVGVHTVVVKATKQKFLAFVLAVIFLAALHTIIDIRLAASVLCSFAGFLYVYVKWKSPVGWQQAFWASVAMHSICNAPATIVLLLRLDQ